MITMKEMLGRHNITDVPHQAELQLEELIRRMNIIRAAWGKPMIVTSGFRLPSDQARINPKAPKSRHLTGNAVDISDPDGELYAWCVKNEALLVEVGLWMEITGGNWCHFQSLPPRSGRRFFHP